MAQIRMLGAEAGGRGAACSDRISKVVSPGHVPLLLGAGLAGGGGSHIWQDIPFPLGGFRRKEVRGKEKKL